MSIKLEYLRLTKRELLRRINRYSHGIVGDIFRWSKDELAALLQELESKDISKCRRSKGTK